MGCCGHSSKPRNRKPRSGFRHLKPKKRLVSQSDVQKKTFLMCRPKYFGIEYEINPWMHLGVLVDRKKAVEQWNTLHDAIMEHGGKLLHVAPQDGLPDMVFTANAGLLLKDINTVILSNFKHEERRAEQWWFHEFFITQKLKVHVVASYYEGAGDSLFLGETLIGGYGFRSDQEVYSEIRHFLKNDPIPVRLVDPRFYHLDTCFCPLSDLDYLIFPGAFDQESLEQIRSLNGRELEVSENEAKNFACNAVLIGKTVILPSECPKTCEMLEQAGYQPVPIPMTEFLKSGGACKCLTMAL